MWVCQPRHLNGWRPFVGVVASAPIVAKVLRLVNNGPMFEVIDMTFQEPMSCAAVPAS
jgi:hypothetical protein